ncbi:MAG: hypothetical protein EZS28_011273 [Streblomastix strix]|uniref:Kinesin motor domain-containing protein n=1 Tax=Streblomastix strix TaxID=222440 RepID=A0A5J4WE08_9EUKA|nr:MAG: hypothetical protein EZS28_011273 [Streblomastix strix]
MDSLITRILRDSLGGNYKTIMLSTISPINSNYEESLMTLQYSELAKQIKNNPISNSYNNQEEIQALQEEIEILKAQSINKPFQNYESVQSQESISKFVSINISQNEEIASSDPSERKQSFKESKQGNFEFAEDIEQEIDFQEKLRSAQEKLDKKRVELILQQEQTYRRESSIYRQKQILAQQLSLLKLEQTTNEEKIEPALQIAERGQELEDETKEIMNQIHDQSIMEDEIARRQAWIDEQRGIREQTVTDLLILLKRLADLTNALEQKKQSQEIANHRKQYLSDMGLSFCETEEVEGTDNQQPQIRNISTDKDLDGHLVYLLPDGVVEVGSYKSETIRSSRKNFILLHGLGIAPTHFAIFYNQKKNTVRLRTIGEEKVLINGQWFGGKKRNEEIDLISTFKSTDTLQINEIDLNDQDRIVIGRNTAFRFINKSENVLKQKTITQQQYNEDDLIQAELAVASGRYSNISDFFSKSQVHEKWLLDVDEANSIVNTLGRKLNYSVEIEHLTMKINIIVNSYERGGGKQTWPLSLLQNRLPLMRSVLNSFLENGIIEDQPELDPFFNPPQDELIGVAQISLRSLMLTGALRVGLSIRSTNFVDEDQIQYQPNGEKKGELKLSMTLKYRKDESIHEQQLQMRNAPKNTFIHLEARDFREPLPNLPILNPVVVKLRHIPDEKLIWDHEVSLTMDFKLISLNKKVQETEGIFIRFFFPYDQEQITPRIYDPGKLGLSATYETHRSNTGSDELSQYEDLLSKSIGKTTTISDFAETVVPDKHLKVLNIKQKFIFPTFSQTDFEFLMKTKLNFEIWGHEQEISESIHILTPRSRLREKIRLNEHNRIQIEMQQNSNSIEKAQKEFDQHQKDLVEMQKQLDALVQRRKNLDEVDSKTCCFIL